jgi:hypothetical protein
MLCPECRNPLPLSIFAAPPTPFGGPRVCPECRRREREEAEAARRAWAEVTVDYGEPIG